MLKLLNTHFPPTPFTPCLLGPNKPVLLGTVFRRVRQIAKSEYELRHICPSVCPSAWNSA